MKLNRSLLVALVLIVCSPLLASAQTRDKASLRLSWVVQGQYAGFIAALEKGFYREEGIDLTINPGGPNVNQLIVVGSGADDFAVGPLTRVVLGRDGGVPVVSIAQIFQKSTLLLVSKKKTGVTHPRDLVGKRVGLWLGNNDAQFYSMLEKYGIPRVSVNVFGQKFTMTPLLEDQLDVASAMSYNEYLTVLEAGYKPEDLNVIAFADHGVGFPQDTIFVTEKTLKERPDLCIRFVRASLKGWKWALDNQEATVEMILGHDASRVQTRTHQQGMLREVAKSVNAGATLTHGLGYLVPEDLKIIGDILYKNKHLKKPLDVNAAFTHEIWKRATGKQ